LLSTGGWARPCVDAHLRSERANRLQIGCPRAAARL